MNKFFGEPVLILVAGGTTLVQAILQFLIAFGTPISEPQQVAIVTLTGLIFALITRSQVTPVATLPPGVAAQIAERAAIADANKP